MCQLPHRRWNQGIAFSLYTFLLLQTFPDDTASSARNVTFLLNKYCV